MSQGPRVGLLVPASNTTMEAELLAWLPEGTRFETRRIERTAGFMSRATLPGEMQRARTLAASLAGQSLDLLIYGCTATGFIAGPAGDASIAADLAEASGLPVVTTARSVIDALQSVDARHIAVVTPYVDAVNDSVRDFLAHHAIDIASLKGFGALTIEQLVNLGAQDVLTLSRAACTPACDALYIACSQLPTRPIIPQLEQELGRPVWSSIKATAWRACQQLETELTP